MKIAYIAHPISGNVTGNLEKIQAIVRRINLQTRDVVPFVPYYVDLLALNDSIPEERDRGFLNNFELLHRATDEVWVFGRISNGVRLEIDYAIAHGLPVIFDTPELEKEYADQRSI